MAYYGINKEGKIVEDRYYIGSSSIATVLGLNRYRTRLQLWAELTGQI